ncbi:unnamed protein product [Pieris macdunnoughi]|uniref:DDE Tnp4 domain-containing protein n=1 Tax=Pieris macdunnoughi TaxID=345717 RepID=A0A821UJQ6_9NEOP|nr:unnamed protein product [Pieris macdunnoughi]
MDEDLLVLLDSPILRWEVLNTRDGVHEINKNRGITGEVFNLYQELRLYPTKFFEYTRMPLSTFDYILSKISPKITKEDTNFRKSIRPEEKLFITLRFLSTGTAFRALAYSFCMGKSTIASIVHETCRVLWTELVPIHMPIPTEQRLKAIAEDFEATWNFPHCIGAIDGKHCEIKKPPKSGSAHWCYKKRNSIVMQAVADAKRKFVAVEVGGRGKQSDGGTFIASTLYKLIEKNKYKIPMPKRLPNSDVIAPYVLVGDEAYPLKHYLMRPYPERVLNNERKCFNIRLSTARQTIECAFGILTCKWRILLKPIETNRQNALSIIKAACILHNVIMDLNGDLDLDVQRVLANSPLYENHQRNCGVNNNPSRRAKNVRIKFTNYFWEQYQRM